MNPKDLFRLFALLVVFTSFIILTLVTEPRGPRRFSQAKNDSYIHGHILNITSSCGISSTSSACCGLPPCDSYPCPAVSASPMTTSVGFYGSSASKPCFGWHFMYLTMIGGCCQIVYFSLAWWHRVAELRAVPGPTSLHATRLLAARDFLFRLIFPLGTMIGVLYWGAIFPMAAGHQTPYAFTKAFIDHAMTTFFVWIELFLFPHQYDHRWKPQIRDCCVLVVSCLIYLAWNLICHAVNGFWVYPFQHLLSVWYLSLLGYGAITVLGVGVFFLGKRLTLCRWGSDFTRNSRKTSMNAQPFLHP